MQIDPVGKDAEGNPLTATYDMEDHFEKYGFSFYLVLYIIQE